MTDKAKWGFYSKHDYTDLLAKIEEQANRIAELEAQRKDLIDEGHEIVVCNQRLREALQFVHWTLGREDCDPIDEALKIINNVL